MISEAARHELSIENRKNTTDYVYSSYKLKSNVDFEDNYRLRNIILLYESEQTRPILWS